MSTISLRTFAPALLLFAATLSPLAADVIWLNEAGLAANPQTGDKGLEGVIRGSNTLRLLWQPYRPGWSWQGAYIEVPWLHVKKVRHEIDTQEDLLTIKSLIRDAFTGAAPRVTQGIPHSPELNPGTVVYSCLEGYARATLSREEAVPGVAEEGLKIVKTILGYYGSPDPSEQQNNSSALREFNIGQEARKTLVTLLTNGRRPSAEATTLDPRLVALEALKLVSDLTYSLKDGDADPRSQAIEVTRTLLDIVLVETLSKRDFVLRRRAEDEVLKVVKNSPRAQEYLRSQFSQPTEIGRKRLAALILVHSGAENSKDIIRAATQHVLELVRSQPVFEQLVQEGDSDEAIAKKSRDYLRRVYDFMNSQADYKGAVCHHASQLLLDLMVTHPEARLHVSEALKELGDRRRVGKSVKLDRALDGLLRGAIELTTPNNQG